MGNMCPGEDAALLASVARDICPFPNYNPSPLFGKMLSFNSSLQLRDHYRTVQSSLTPKQLEDFTQGLRTTFGREGKVTHGGVGLVALSLAVLFDTLARKARGEWVSDSGPIPGLFLKGPRGYYPPHVYTASEYLRLVPHIANNPTRMREESERYLKQLKIDDLSLDKVVKSDRIPIREEITAVNMMLGFFFATSLQYHIHRINSMLDVHGFRSRTEEPDEMVFNLNCDPEAVHNEFLAEVQKSDRRTQDAFENCKTVQGRDLPKTWLHRVAWFEWLHIMHIPLFTPGIASFSSMVGQRGEFDLKANALGKWVE
ncbi:uncharacterized protein LOC119497927 [Sebastes umbrosus]|uniref:uncharacterized protein LOC119497927 n=1 Tax=Sebastes umbrosus TaxID=72105 RepID=UPI0018A051CB|nr:uncharacterized protein LOC119497927 [Sebastes umbrosus]